MNWAAFIHDNGLVVGWDDYRRWMDDFSAELSLGLAGGDSSLRMIPAYVDPHCQTGDGQSVIVLDAGGTNLRVALVEFPSSGEPTATHFEVVPMPGTQGTLSIDDFYSQLATLLAPIAHKSDRIGFCFSFPCEILPNHDGKILHFDKEVEITNSPGSILGEGLRRALQQAGLPHHHKVAVINDTVAALLGAKAQEKNAADYIGFILGTGTNLCYTESNGNVTKSTHLAALPGHTAINVESGGFSKMTRSPVDIAFDAATADPGAQQLEKLISGAYQGPLMLAYLKAAAKSGVFSPAAAVQVAAMATLSAKEISQFVDTPDADSPLARLARCTQEDRQGLTDFVDAFFHRAALLTAATLTAVLEKLGTAQNPQNPVVICAEGTTFYHATLLHHHLTTYMTDYAQGKLGLHCRFVRGDNVNITGSALAALSI